MAFEESDGSKIIQVDEEAPDDTQYECSAIEMFIKSQNENKGDLIGELQQSIKEQGELPCIKVGKPGTYGSYCHLPGLTNCIFLQPTLIAPK